MKELNQNIKDKNFHKVYLLYGGEEYLIRTYKNRLKQSMLGRDRMNYTYFEGKNINENEFINTALTLPFFAERRCIVVENSGWLKAPPEAVAELFKHLPETSNIIFAEKEVDKRNKLYKRIKEIGYVAELSSPGREELKNWAAMILAEEGKKITVKNMDVFLEYTGENMDIIASELEKLITYVGEKEKIDLSDIEDITTIGVNNRIFDMVSAIIMKKTDYAMHLYDDLLALKEPPLRILFFIARHINQLLMVKNFSKMNMERENIAKELGVQPFVVGKLLQQARRFEISALESYLRRCIELEENIKKGEIPERLGVELIICGYE